MNGAQRRAAVSVRPAKPEDAEVVVKMAAALSAQEGKPPSRFTADHFRREGFGSGAVFTTLVAEVDNTIVGYALFYPGYDVESASRGLHLADLYVVETARRQGVGRALLAAVVRECRNARGQWVSWFVEETNLSWSGILPVDWGKTGERDSAMDGTREVGGSARTQLTCSSGPCRIVVSDHEVGLRHHR
jgi:GNAT superfamily N-acetyltransferase